jgi:FemAB-related protein (PEP-CTERM system-associated)
VLDALMEKKGVLSRQIGEAKRDGKAIDELLLEMKQVSSEINKLKKKQKKVKQALNSPEKMPEESPALRPENLLPGLFSGSENIQLPSEIIDVRRLKNDEYSAWDDYVASKPNSSIYHFSAFKTVIESSFKHEVIYLAAYTSTGKICGILPAVELNSRLFGHFLVSLPYFTYGGVLSDSEVVSECLYAALFKESRLLGVEHVELRATTIQNPLQKDMPAKLSKVSMVRSLPESIDQLWDDIGTKVRAQIKKAQRFDLEIKFGKGELLNDFYQVFAENMRDLGTPVYSKTFFKELISGSLSKSFDLGVVYFEGKPVSTCFLMRHKGMMEIPWASALNSFNYMNVNMYMYWEVLQYAIQTGNKFFDFGRSSKDAGTYRFKKQWGAEPQQLYWYYWLPSGGELPELNPNNPKYKLLISVWQKLPVWLTKWIGPPVVKYLP